MVATVQKNSILNIKKLSKHQILQRPGELNTKVYIVKSGLLRSYTIDAKGKEHTFMFAPENWIIGDAVPPGEPAELFIDTLEDSEVAIVQKNLDDSTADKRRFINRMRVLQKRVAMLLGATAIERYEEFVKDYPDIVQRVPQRMIASYLGITPEALSKVKSARGKNK